MSDQGSDNEIFLTQSTSCARRSSDEWTDEFIHPEIVAFAAECSSDDELSQVAANAEVIYSSQNDTYSDVRISPASAGAVKAFKEDNSTNLKPPSSRFKAPRTDTEMNTYQTRSFASSTKRKCKWAAELFGSWQTSRNEVALFDNSISAIHPKLENMTKDELCYSISRFLCEVRKTTGEEYPPQTLYEIIICLQLHLELDGKPVKLLQDSAFLQIKNTLDHVMKERSKEGVIARGRQAEIISLADEDILWQKVLGFDCPRKLIDTVLYLFGLNFALRAGTEHRNLRWEKGQMEVLNDSHGRVFLKYTEDVSKGNQGGLQHRAVKKKIVYAYGNETRPERCIVRAYQLYDHHCPEERPAFYLRPLNNPKDNVWYSSQPIGMKTLTKTVGRLCEKAGLTGFRTNHSLRATAATRLYEANIDEQLITEVTGHRSLAVREYKRTGDHQRFCGSAIVAGRSVPDSPIPTKKPCNCQHSSETHSVSTMGTSLTLPHITVNVNVQK